MVALVRILLFALAIVTAATVARAAPPEITPAPGLAGASQLWRGPDGEIRLYLKERGALVALTSRDGRGWERRAAEPELAGLNPHGAVFHTDRRGGDHVFFLRKRCIEACLVPNRTIFIDVMTQFRPRGGAWGPARALFEGYVGALRQIAETTDGRLVLPFARWVPDRANGPPTGSHDVRLLVSDDGADWRMPEAALTAPTPRAPNAPGFGAVEPSIVQLADGRLWLVMRTQTGLLWQSFSRDGETWSPPEASPLAAPSAPVWLTPLPGGETLVLLNNQHQPSRNRGRFVYGGRDLLHAALTRDAARFVGLREVHRDPLLMTPPARGDFGAAYPTAVLLDDGAVLALTGQGEGRLAWIRLDPAWLREPGRETQGDDGLTAFAERGEVVDRKRARSPVFAATGGLDLAALSAGGAALWNFPLSDAGEISLAFAVEGRLEALSLHLLDRFVNPGDAALATLSLGRCEIAPAAGLVRLGWARGALHCGGAASAMRPGRANYLYITGRGEGVLRIERIAMRPGG